MVILRFVLVILLFGAGSVNAEDSSAPLSNILNRTEYTNKGLLKGINYNVWWYRAFSLGTSWNRPENMISKINARSERSDQDAQELLIELSGILKDASPAGEYVTDLYRRLLSKSQNTAPIPTDIIRAILNDRGILNGSIDFNDLNIQLLDFISKEMKPIALNLVDNEDIIVLDKVLNIYLGMGDFTSYQTLEGLLNLVTESTSREQKINVAEKIMRIQVGPLYYSNKESEITQRTINLLRLRRNIITSLPPETQISIATQAIQNTSFSGNNTTAYFNFKKIEHDILLLEDLGAKDSLMLLAEKIEDAVKLLERMDRDISNRLARIAVSTGYRSSGTSGYISSGYSTGSVK